MIYIPITSDEIPLYIPKSQNAPEGGEYSFRMYNTTNRHFTVDQIFDNGDFNEDFNADFAIGMADVLVSEGGKYFSFLMSFDTNMPVGDYEYFFAKNGVLLSHGVARFGEFKRENEQYIKDVKYEQYNG